MLDENPFLERNVDEAPREEFGLDSADAAAPRDVRDEETAGLSLMNGADGVSTIATQDAEVTTAEAPAEIADAEPDWEGDGTVEMAPDDSEWGSDAPARANNLGDDERADATELARSQESLQDFLHRQALGLRLSEVDRAALRFLIESLNDDGYLEDSLPGPGLGPGRRRQRPVRRAGAPLPDGAGPAAEPGAGRRGRARPGRMPGDPGARAGARGRVRGKGRAVQDRAGRSASSPDPAGAARLQAPGHPHPQQRGAGAQRHAAHRAAGAQAGPALRQRGAQHRGARRDRHAHRQRHQRQVPGAAQPRRDAAPEACTTSTPARSRRTRARAARR